MRFLKLGRNAKSGKDTWWMVKGVDAQGCALLVSVDVRDLGWFKMPGVFSATQLAQDESAAIFDEICPDAADRAKLANIELRFEVKGVHHSFYDSRLAVAYAGVLNFDEFAGEVYAFDAAKCAWGGALQTQEGTLSSKCNPKSNEPAVSLGCDAKPQGMNMDSINATSNSSYCESGLRFSFDQEKLSERFFVTRYTGDADEQINRVAMRIAVMTAPGALGSLRTYTESGYVTSLKLSRALKELDAAQQDVHDAEQKLDDTREQVRCNAIDNVAAKVEREQAQARDEIARAKESLEHAGIFGFGKKRQLKAQIEQLEARIADIGSQAEGRKQDAAEHALANSAQIAEAKEELARATAKLERARGVVRDLDRKLQES